METSSLFILDEADLPASRSASESAPVSEAHRRLKLRAFLRDETELQRREFHQFVSRCIAGQHCPSSETFSGPDLPEGTRVRASDLDYIAYRSGWRRLDLEAFVSAKPRKSQLYVPRKAKRDRAAEWRARADAFAAQAASQGGGDQRRVESSCV